MERRVFFATLFAVFIFLSVAITIDSPVFYATGTVQLEKPGIATEMRMFFNGTEGNSTFEPGLINITAVLNVSGKTVYLATNIANWTTNSGTTPLQNLTYFGADGVYNVTAWFPGDVNYTGSSITYFLTISTPAPPGPGPGGGGGPEIGVPINITPPEVPSEFYVDIIDYDEAHIIGTNLPPGNYYADLSNSIQLPITAAGFSLRDFVGHFEIIIENISQPPGIPGLEEQYGLEMPYQYINVTVIGIDPQAAFRTINMNFKVEKDWIFENRIDEGTITLYRYENGRWLPLSAIKTGEDDDYSRFHAGDVRAFSAYFVVSGKQLITLPPLLVPSYVVAPMTYVQLAILLFAILLLLFLIRRRRKPLVIEEQGW